MQACTGSNAKVELLAYNGTTVNSAITSSGTVSTFNYLPLVPASTPLPTSPVQTDPVQRLNAVRYVRVSAAPGNCLTLREVWVFDSTNANVALMKPTTSSAQTAGNTAAMGVNGVIDFDSE